MSDYSKQIEDATFKFLEANSSVIVKSIENQVKASMDEVISQIAIALSLRMGKFLDDNKDDLTTSIAAAIAASYNNRHPS